MMMKVQYNDRTNMIKPNQRFLFGSSGNWIAFKTIGAGFINYLNKQTYDNSSVGVIEINLVSNYVNYDTDDIVKGIADVYQNNYTLSVNPTALSISTAQTFTVIPTITYNGETITRPLEWESSNIDIATVDSNGLVTAVSNGDCTITVNIKENSTFANCAVHVSASPTDNYIVSLAPDKNYVLEKETQTYLVYLVKNQVQQADTFSFSINAGNIPYENYLFTIINGNSFSIKNLKKYIGEDLIITCTSGTYSLVVNITLKGAW